MPKVPQGACAKAFKRARKIYVDLQERWTEELSSNQKLAAVYDPNGVVFKNLVYALVNTNEKNKNKAPVGLFMQNIAKQIREWMNGESTYPYPISYKQYESIQSASFLRSN